jgi:ribose-phosphate pyrophosphokinase
MLNLNLINLQKSDIGYTISTFPDGEPYIKLEEFSRREEINVITRITCPDELFRLMQVGDILNRHGVVWNVYITYLMSSRMDRVMSFQEPFSLEIVAACINNLKPAIVELLCPHSDRVSHLISNCGYTEYPFDYEDLETYDYICYPDKGAAKRYAYLVEDESKTLICTKVRDPQTGQLSGFQVSNPEVYKGEGKSICVVDDLCDGGGTFIGVGSLLKDNYNPENLILVITHAIQLEGLKKVATVYDQVYITNSYKNWKDVKDLPENITVIEVL